MVQTSNYNNWQYGQFKKYIGKKVLEIGCGLGNITQYLIEDTEYLLCVDVKPEAIKYIRRRIPAGTKVHIEKLDIFSNGLQKYSKENFDTIVFANVLEHLKDDLSAMKVCRKILKKTHGRLLLLVPAHNYLFGTLDKEAGHYRRYEKNDIRKLALHSGFKIIDLYEFNFIGALGWFMNYCVLKRKNTNNAETSSQVGIYDRIIVKPSRFIESVVKPPFGISLIAIMEVES